MLDKVTSWLQSRQAILPLLSIFCLLVVATVFVGLKEVAGYVLGYLATLVLFLVATRNWRSVWRFVILFAVSLAGIFFLSFLFVEVISRLAVWVGGVAALEGLPLRIIELIITYVIIFAGPAGMAVGIGGAAALGVSRLPNRGNRSHPAMD